MIYEPREDSFLLASLFSDFIFENTKVLDVGCGSGFLSVQAKNLGADVVSIDINPESVDYCKSLGLNVLYSDLFENVKDKFDVIVFNPPYLPEDEDEDEESKLITTGGEEGFEVLVRFLKDARFFLKSNGVILVVVSTLTGDAESFFKKHEYKFELLKSEEYFFEKLLVYKLFL